MKKLIIVLMAAVLIAGCTGQPPAGGTEGTGLAMTSFTSDVSSQMSGRDVRLFLDVENQGESTVNMSRTLIYLNGPIGTGILQWPLMEGTKTAKIERDLNPYDPLKDIPAGRDSVSWRLRAPQMDSGQQKTDTFTARTYYDYETRVNGEIIAYTEAESVALKQKGETLAAASFTSTRSPLTVTIRSIPDPVIITNTDETVTLELTVENTGGGTLYENGLISALTSEPSLGYDQLNKVYMRVDAGALQANLKGDCNGTQELIGGKPTTLTCDITIPKGSVSTMNSFPIKINLEYGYYMDLPLQLTVVGKS